MSSVVSSLRNFVVGPLLDFVYPPLCFTCGARVDEGSVRICPACWGSMRTVMPSDPVWVEIAGKLRDGLQVDELLSCFLFEKQGPLQGIIHLLKYQGMKSFGRVLGREIGRKVLADPAYRGADLLVPVPLHKRKKRERGYNQCEYLCAGIADVVPIEVGRRVLERTRHTTSQTQLSLADRKANVRGAFRSMSPPAIDGKIVILIDDVITTGSTIDACASVLRRAGARSVLAACVALAP